MRSRALLWTSVCLLFAACGGLTSDPAGAPKPGVDAGVDALLVDVTSSTDVSADDGTSLPDADADAAPDAKPSEDPWLLTMCGQNAVVNAKTGARFDTLGQAWAPDGRLFYVAPTGHTIYALDVLDSGPGVPELIATLPKDTWGWSFDFAPNGKAFVVKTNTGNYVVAPGTAPSQPEPIGQDFAWSPGGAYISHVQNGALYLRDPSVPNADDLKLADSVVAHTWGPGDSKLVVIRDLGSTRELDVVDSVTPAPAIHNVYDTTAAELGSALWLEDGAGFFFVETSLVGWGSQSTVYFCELGSGTDPSVTPLQNGPIGMSPDGRFFVFASLSFEDGGPAAELRLWQPGAPFDQSVWSSPGGLDSILYVAWAPASQRLFFTATNGGPGTVGFLLDTSGSTLGSAESIDLSDYGLGGPEFSPDGKSIVGVVGSATALNGGALDAIEISSNGSMTAPVDVFPGHVCQPDVRHWSPKGDYVAIREGTSSFSIYVAAHAAGAFASPALVAQPAGAACSFEWSPK